MANHTEHDDVVVKISPPFARDVILLLSRRWNIDVPTDFLVLRDLVGRALGEWVLSHPQGNVLCVPQPEDSLVGWARIEAAIDGLKEILKGNWERGEIKEEGIPSLVTAIRTAQGTCAMVIAGFLKLDGEKE